MRLKIKTLIMSSNFRTTTIPSTLSTSKIITQPSLSELLFTSLLKKFLDSNNFTLVAKTKRTMSLRNLAPKAMAMLTLNNL